MKFLIVEDDAKIAAFLAKGLTEEGHSIVHAADGVDGLAMASADQYDAVVVDVMLPKLDGLTLIEQLRKQGDKTPVLILSAKASVDDRVLGLKKGGDDYLTKPFSFAELVARLEALVRRTGLTDDLAKLTVADLEIDIAAHRVTRNGKTLDLQPKEFSLLVYLARNRSRVVSKTMIMEHVWGYDFDPQTNVVEARVSRLRDKIDVGRQHSLIKTIRGSGYMVEANA